MPSHLGPCKSIPLAPRTSEVHAITALSLLPGPFYWITLLRAEYVTNIHILRPKGSQGTGFGEGEKALEVWDGAGSGKEKVACRLHLHFHPDLQRPGVGQLKPL